MGGYSAGFGRREGALWIRIPAFGKRNKWRENANRLICCRTRQESLVFSKIMFDVPVFPTFFAKCIGVWEDSLFPLFRGRNPLKDENLGKKKVQGRGFGAQIEFKSPPALVREGIGWGSYFSRGGERERGFFFFRSSKTKKEGIRIFLSKGARKCDHTWPIFLFPISPGGVKAFFSLTRL